MSGRPWYKRYPVDFVHGTMGLMLEEKGAYSILLDLIYDRGGPIVDEPRYIAGVCNCSLRKWTAIRRRLIETGKIVITEGRISNSRAEKEIEIAANSARIHAENGAKGGRQRIENAGIRMENNGLAPARLEPARAVQRPESESDQSKQPCGSLDAASRARAAFRPSTPRAALEAVVDAGHAADVIDHRRRLGAPLTAASAGRLAAKLAQWPDPNEAVDEMLAAGWTGFESAWLERRRLGRGVERGPPTPSSLRQSDRLYQALMESDDDPQRGDAPRYGAFGDSSGDGSRDGDGPGRDAWPDAGLSRAHPGRCLAAGDPHTRPSGRLARG